MHLQDINFLINIQELKITNIYINEDNRIVLAAEPVEYIQPCPCCNSHAITRQGIPYYRTVRHLPVFEKAVYLHLPSIRLQCKECNANFVWQYDCIAPRKRYTKAFEQSIAKHALGSMVKHASKVLDAPYTTLERSYEQWMDTESSRIQQKCLTIAKESKSLVLGIDDFAIRKGHSYNTGLHDLRNETFLDIIRGRTIQELRDHYNEHPELFALEPVAVVMDLAKCYHSFIKEVYPNAIRIADRFHVNRYVTEALQEVRREVCKTLAPHARKKLKEKHALLGKRNDQLTPIEQSILKEILGYSNELKCVYEWKEAFIDWYDYSLNVKHAAGLFKKWCKKGHSLNISSVEKCLRTLENWQEEIVNYHFLRFTNAAVEGRNGKIKSLQRRHYFTRNKKCYKQRIILECNTEYVVA